MLRQVNTLPYCGFATQIGFRSLGTRMREALIRLDFVVKFTGRPEAGCEKHLGNPSWKQLATLKVPRRKQQFEILTCSASGTTTTPEYRWVTLHDKPPYPVKQQGLQLRRFHKKLKKPRVAR